MKKTLLAMSLAVASVSSFAAPLTWTDAPTDGAVDSTTAGIEWVSELPTVMPGKWITFTGAGGAPLKAGAFTIEADGSFATDQTVALEVHYYDETTAEVGDLINLTDAVDGAAVKITKVDYTIGDVMFESEKGADVSGVKAIIKQGEDLAAAQVVNPNVAYSYSDFSLDDATAGVTFWSINSGVADVFTERLPGDKITASALVTVDMEFGGSV